MNLGLLPVFIDAVGKKLDKISEMQDSSPLLFEATSVPKHQLKKIQHRMDVFT